MEAERGAWMKELKRCWVGCWGAGSACGIGQILRERTGDEAGNLACQAGINCLCLSA